MEVYLYSRVSTAEQSLEQQERTVYEWLKRHDMTVSHIVSDEGVSGGVSYKDRKLGKELLPMMKAGDVLIVSEISRLGRSMYDLSTLIHTELKPRKIRLVVVGMGLDLRCDNLTAMDELILNNFSFAAQLEKQLISERTKSALSVKRKQGIKIGAASEKYKRNKERKSQETIDAEKARWKESMKKRYLESKDVQAFMKILSNIFPSVCDASKTPDEWRWWAVTTKGEAKNHMLTMMRNYHDINNDIFKTWNFDDEPLKLQVKLAGTINTLKKNFINN